MRCRCAVADDDHVEAVHARTSSMALFLLLPAAPQSRFFRSEQMRAQRAAGCCAGHPRPSSTCRRRCAGPRWDAGKASATRTVGQVIHEDTEKKPDMPPSLPRCCWRRRGGLGVDLLAVEQFGRVPQACSTRLLAGGTRPAWRCWKPRRRLAEKYYPVRAWSALSTCWNTLRWTGYEASVPAGPVRKRVMMHFAGDRRRLRARRRPVSLRREHARFSVKRIKEFMVLLSMADGGFCCSDQPVVLQVGWFARNDRSSCCSLRSCATVPLRIAFQQKKRLAVA